MQLDDIEDMGNKLLVSLPDTKTKRPRSFVVSEHLDMYRKYASYRPSGFESRRFFFRYWRGKALKQVIGIHKFGAMPQEIATYLKLPNAQKYTGHCFRRTSATWLVNSGADITMLKRHGGWKSTSVAEGYIENSVESKSVISEKILANIPTCSDSGKRKDETSSSSVYLKNSSNEVNDKSIIIEGCSHFTVNVYK